MFKLLVVEDDRELNRAVCSFLNRNGYDALGCLSANEAYDAMYDGTLLIRGILAVANVEVFAAEDDHLTHELVRDVLWNGHQADVAGAVGQPFIMIFGFSALDELARHDPFCPIFDAVHLTNPFHLAVALRASVTPA